MDTIALWHEIVVERDLDRFPELLAEDVTFHSPVVHAPAEGRAATALYLTAALGLLLNGSFTYVRQIVGERDAALEFTTVIDGITVNGVDLLTWGDDGRLTDVKVMIRPRRAYDLVQSRMAAMLASLMGEG